MWDAMRTDVMVVPGWISARWTLEMLWEYVSWSGGGSLDGRPARRHVLGYSPGSLEDMVPRSRQVTCGALRKKLEILAWFCCIDIRWCQARISILHKLSDPLLMSRHCLLPRQCAWSWNQRGAQSHQRPAGSSVGREMSLLNEPTGIASSKMQWNDDDLNMIWLWSV